MLLCQNESTCETIHMKMSSVYRFIFMQIKLVHFHIKGFSRDSFLKQRQGNSEMTSLMFRCNEFERRERHAGIHTGSANRTPRFVMLFKTGPKGNREFCFPEL